MSSLGRETHNLEMSSWDVQLVSLWHVVPVVLFVAVVAVRSAVAVVSCVAASLVLLRPSPPPVHPRCPGWRCLP